jgi:hypothetical protein
MPPAVSAHNPVFSPGPHVTYEGGFEVTAGYEQESSNAAAGDDTEREFKLEFEYGLTPDWTAELELPYRSVDSGGTSSTGVGDVVFRSRYRFYRDDLPGEQRSAALLAQVKLPSGDEHSRPRLGSGSTDFVGGLLFGREGRRWYYYGAARYRWNTRGAGGLKRGDRQFVDLAGGVRPVLTGYLEPDTVLFLELNFENAARDQLRGSGIGGTGGWELFVSPGLFWTYRNVAIRGGVQLPVAEGLNARQPESDYRVKLEFRAQF